jgi:CheY-like chemotaxis protein
MNKYTILIADDDENLCYLLKEELVNEGYIVDIVYDGKDAIEAIKKKNFDVVLLDLEMKEVSGEQVLKFVKENHPDLQVIVLTAKFVPQYIVSNRVLMISSLNRMNSVN